jgi:hypothetical protein
MDKKRSSRIPGPDSSRGQKAINNSFDIKVCKVDKKKCQEATNDIFDVKVRKMGLQRLHTKFAASPKMI